MSVNISEYRYILVKCEGDSWYLGCLFFDRKNTKLTLPYLGIGNSASGAFGRSITKIEDSGITFDNGYQGTNIRNDTSVPTHIYGFKYDILPS